MVLHVMKVLISRGLGSIKRFECKNYLFETKFWTMLLADQSIFMIYILSPDLINRFSHESYFKKQLISYFSKLQVCLVFLSCVAGMSQLYLLMVWCKFNFFSLVFDYSFRHCLNC